MSLDDGWQLYPMPQFNAWPAEALHTVFPRMMIYGSEDVNAKTSRGTITTSRPDGRCSEYGCDATLDTGPWRSWVPVVENPYVAGVGSHRMAFHGLAMILARADDHPGTITVKARTKGLPAATITLDTISERSSNTIR
jgi:hypothetical protein